MSQYINICQITANPTDYIFASAELQQISVSELRQIALAKDITVNEVRKFGDLRRRRSWQNAILEAQQLVLASKRQEQLLEQVNHPHGEPEEVVTQCDECPFARYSGISPFNGKKLYVCSCWGIDDQHGGHVPENSTPTNTCYQELRKARDRVEGYSRHYLNDRTDKLNKKLRAEVSPQSLAWFVDWQQKSDWMREKQHEQATEEMLEELELQQQVTIAQPTLMQHEMFASIVIHPVHSYPLIGVWHKSNLVCYVEANVTLPSYVAYTGDGSNFVECSEFLDAVFAFQKQQQLWEVGIF